MAKLKYLLLIISFLSFQLTWSQVSLNLTFPDYTIEDSSQKPIKESSDWEYVQVRMKIKDTDSSFSIDFMDQKESGVIKTKSYELFQSSEWMLNDGIDICVATNKDKSKRYLVYFISPKTATNQVWMSLTEIKKEGLERKGNIIHLKNFHKNQRETLMFLNPDGLSAYQYIHSFDNTLISRTLNIARKFSKDSIKLRYTSQKAYIKNQPNWLGITSPVEVPFQSTLLHRNISRNLDFKEGVYTYRNDSILDNKGLYGMSIGSKEGFEKFKYAWFVPGNIEILKYRSNRKGTWKAMNNSIVFSGKKGINSVLFEIVFRIKNTQAKEIEKTKIEVKEVVKVPHKKVRISVWDNKAVDGDIISISLNGEWIIRNLEVTKCKTTFSINLPHTENFLVMKAENLGSSPPNTAAFEISAGNFNKQIILNSDMGKSEMIVLRRDK